MLIYETWDRNKLITSGPADFKIHCVPPHSMISYHPILFPISLLEDHICLLQTHSIRIIWLQESFSCVWIGFVEGILGRKGKHKEIINWKSYVNVLDFSNHLSTRSLNLSITGCLGYAYLFWNPEVNTEQTYNGLKFEEFGFTTKSYGKIKLYLVWRISVD